MLRYGTLPLIALVVVTASRAADPIRDLQNAAIDANKSDVAHWGLDRNNYTQWTTHSLRLIPVYTFGTAGGGAGVDLNSYIGANSPYRTEAGVRRLYGHPPLVGQGFFFISAQAKPQITVAVLLLDVLAQACHAETHFLILGG